MAYETTLSPTKGVWTQVTNALVSAIRLQNVTTQHSVYVKATVDGTAPTNAVGAITLGPMQVIPADLTLAQLFPGVVSTTGRVWVCNYDVSPTVSVSHA